MSFYLPLHSEQQGELVEQLQLALNNTGLDRIKVRTANYWHGYQNGLRFGRKGLYFAAPHFAAWSINQHDFIPMLRIDDSLKFVIASKQADSQYFEINDLNQKKICAQRALNLDYLLVNTAFDNRLLSANIVSVWSVNNELHNDQTECVAFAINDHKFVELEQSHPGKFIRLQQGSQFNNYAFVAHPSFDVEQIDNIKQFLLRKDVQKILRPLYRLSATKTSLVTARKADYPREYLQPLAPYWQRKK